MSYAVVASFVVSALYFVYRMITQAKIDHTIASALKKADHESEDKEISIAQKELNNAEINYRKSRAEYDNSIRGSNSDPK